MLRLSDNPPIRWPLTPSLREMPGVWWVGHAKARFEKAFAWDLHARGIGYFLPMVQRITFSGGRKRRGMTPLFAGYVFFCGDEQVRHTALTTGRLCQVIAVPEQQRLVEELGQIERALSRPELLDAYPFAAMGRRCRVARGPLEGLAGTVIQRDGARPRLVLQVSILGQGAAVEIDADLLEEE